MEDIEKIVRLSLAGWKARVGGEFDLSKTPFKVLSVALGCNSGESPSLNLPSTPVRLAFIYSSDNQRSGLSKNEVNIVINLYTTFEEAQGAAQRYYAKGKEPKESAYNLFQGESGLSEPPSSAVQFHQLEIGNKDQFIILRIDFNNESTCTSRHLWQGGGRVNKC